MSSFNGATRLEKASHGLEALCEAWMKGSHHVLKSSQRCGGFSRQREGSSVRFEEALGRFFSFSKSSMASSIEPWDLTKEMKLRFLIQVPNYNELDVLCDWS